MQVIPSEGGPEMLPLLPSRRISFSDHEAEDFRMGGFVRRRSKIRSLRTDESEASMGLQESMA